MLTTSTGLQELPQQERYDAKPSYFSPYSDCVVSIRVRAINSANKETLG
jgi:hypothetical protein